MCALRRDVAPGWMEIGGSFIHCTGMSRVQWTVEAGRDLVMGEIWWGPRPASKRLPGPGPEADLPQRIHFGSHIRRPDHAENDARPHSPPPKAKFVHHGDRDHRPDGHHPGGSNCGESGRYADQVGQAIYGPRCVLT